MKRWKKLLTVVTVTLILTSISLPTAFAQEKIIIGEPSWPNARVIANIIKTVITDRLGGKAETVPSTNAVIFKAMDRGKGDMDVHPDVWLPNQQSLVDEYVVNKGTVALNKVGYKGRAGFAVPTYVVKKMGIKSVFDLATPEAAKLFDSDGDGKGEIWVGPAAWAASKMRRVKVRDYGIGNFFNPTQEDEVFAYAKVGNAIKKNEAVVFAAYAPHYMFKLHDLTLLEEPAYDPEKYKFIAPDKDADWLAKSTIKCADAPKTVHVAYSKSLEKRAPEIAKLLSNLTLDSETMSALVYAVSVDKLDPADVATDWVNNNLQHVDTWLGLN